MNARLVRAAACAVAIAAACTSARADEPQRQDAVAAGSETPGKDTPPKAKPARTDDLTTKHYSFEMASYTDTDHVTVYTPSIGASLENITTGASIRARYLVDVVSAASVDIVSTASRRWVEGRQAGNIVGEYKPHDFGVQVAGSASSEPDYLSYGFGLGLTKEFDEKNTTATFGYGYSHDTAGRSSTPFSVFARDLQRGSFNAGVAQVLNRSSVLSLTLDVQIENGDQSKPYRYIPMFTSQEAALVPKGASIDFVNQNRLPEKPLEQLPLARHRFALTTRYAYRFDDSTARVEERIYDDNWGLIASTTDARWIFDLGRRFAVGPHTRFHVQTPVSFWQRAYVSGSSTGFDLPEFRTGDRELGPLWTFTGGGSMKVFLGSGSDPQTFALGLTGDIIYTAYTDDIFLTSRTGFLGALTLDWER